METDPPTADRRFTGAMPALSHVKCVPAALMKSAPGPPMTLGNTAGARARLIVWCGACGHRTEPEPAEMAERYGPETTVPEWRERLVCSRCGSRDSRHGGDRDRAAEAALTPPYLNLRADCSRPFADIRLGVEIE